MDRTNSKQKLIAFLRTIQRADYPLDSIDDSMSLTQSGLIDSLATLEIIEYLETKYRIDFARTGVDPEELQSVNSILDYVERHTPQ